MLIMIGKCIVCRKIAVVRFENYTDVQGILVSRTNIHTQTHTNIYLLIYIYSLQKNQISITGQKENFGNITFLPP